MEHVKEFRWITEYCNLYEVLRILIDDIEEYATFPFRGMTPPKSRANHDFPIGSTGSITELPSVGLVMATQTGVRGLSFSRLKPLSSLANAYKNTV